MDKLASASSPCANAPKFLAARSKFRHSPLVVPSFISKSPASRWNPMPNKLTVLLVDDHALVRRGFRRILEDEPTFQVVREASDGLEAVQLAEHLHPAVVVMDCALPQINGIEATRRIHAKFPDIAILMLSMHSEDTLVRRSLEARARGYILHTPMDLHLFAPIQRIPQGKTVLDPQINLTGNLKGERD